MDSIKDIKIRIEKILEENRPYLQIDNGDIELIEVTEDGIAKVRFMGSCFTCALKPMTLRGGIERVIMFNVPEIKRVEEV